MHVPGSYHFVIILAVTGYFGFLEESPFTLRVHSSSVISAKYMFINWILSYLRQFVFLYLSCVLKGHLSVTLILTQGCASL